MAESGVTVLAFFLRGSKVVVMESGTARLLSDKVGAGDGDVADLPVTSASLASPLRGDI